jgi:hypothetical protein
MARTVRTKVYKFNELSTEAKAKAKEWYYGDGYVGDLSAVMQEQLELFLDGSGIDFKNAKVFYSLGYSQGDGVCFTGTFTKDGLMMELTHNSRYYYARSVTSQFFDANSEEREEDEAGMDFFNEYVNICRILEKHGYDLLEYRMPDDEFSEHCDINNYEFYESGKIYA